MQLKTFWDGLRAMALAKVHGLGLGGGLGERAEKELAGRPALRVIQADDVDVTRTIFDCYALGACVDVREMVEEAGFFSALDNETQVRLMRLAARGEAAREKALHVAREVMLRGVMHECENCETYDLFRLSRSGTAGEDLTMPFEVLLANARVHDDYRLVKNKAWTKDRVEGEKIDGLFRDVLSRATEEEIQGVLRLGGQHLAGLTRYGEGGFLVNSFGGERWKKIAQAAEKLWGEEPTTADMEYAVTLAHNTGSVFKPKYHPGCRWQGWEVQKLLDIKRAAPSVSALVGRVSEEFDSFTGDAAREPCGEYVGEIQRDLAALRRGIERVREVPSYQKGPILALLGEARVAAVTPVPVQDGGVRHLAALEAEMDEEMVGEVDVQRF